MPTSYTLAHGAAARRPRRLPHADPADLSLPADFPRDVAVVATDLDHTLIWQDRALRPRTLAVLHRARAAGLHVIVVTGRMVQSLQRVVPPSLLGEPAICYQGAVVVDADGTWLRARADRARAGARGDRRRRGRGLRRRTSTSTTSCTSRSMTEHAESYASFQGLDDPRRRRRRRRGSTGRRRRSSASATRTCSTASRSRMKETFAGRLTISKSLPYFLEFSALGITKGAGLDFLAERMGFTRRADDRVRRRRERRRAGRVGRLRDRGRERARTREGGRRLGLPARRGRGRRRGARGASRLTAVIDLRAARADPDRFRAALARKGARRRVRRAARGRRALARARPGGRRAARAAEARRASRRRSSSRS